MSPGAGGETRAVFERAMYPAWATLLGPCVVGASRFIGTGGAGGGAAPVRTGAAGRNGHVGRCAARRLHGIRRGGVRRCWSGSRIQFPRPSSCPGWWGSSRRCRIRSGHGHAAVLALDANSGASRSALAEAYGELGLVLQAVGFYEAAEHAYLNAQARAPGAVRWPYLPGAPVPIDGTARKGARALPAGNRSGAGETFRRWSGLARCTWIRESRRKPSGPSNGRSPSNLRRRRGWPGSARPPSHARMPRGPSLIWNARWLSIRGRRASTTASAWRTGTSANWSWPNSIFGGGAAERPGCPTRCFSNRPASWTVPWRTSGAVRARSAPGGTPRPRRRFGPALR